MATLMVMGASPVGCGSVDSSAACGLWPDPRSTRFHHGTDHDRWHTASTVVCGTGAAGRMPGSSSKLIDSAAASMARATCGSPTLFSVFGEPGTTLPSGAIITCTAAPPDCAPDGALPG